MVIFINKQAQSILNYLLSHFEGEGNYKALAVSGYFREGNRFTCFDNRSYSCWVEETENEQKAIAWCKGEIDLEELYYESKA